MGILSPSLPIPKSSALTGYCPSDNVSGGPYHGQCFLAGDGNWLINTGTATDFTVVWTINQTFSNFDSSPTNLLGCSSASKDQEGFDAQLNWYKTGTNYPWTQEIVAANTAGGGNTCHTVEYFPTSTTSTPDCDAQMIGGSTYDSEFNTSSNHYVKIHDTAASSKVTDFNLQVSNPSDTWTITPGSSSANGCGSGTGGGTGLPATITSWATTSPKSEFNFIFSGVASSGSIIGFSFFKTVPGDGDAIPYFLMQVWYDQGITSPLPTIVDAPAEEQSNAIYSNAYISPVASPDGGGSALTQEINCLLGTISVGTFFCS